jgi:hypothetical protein
MADVGVSDTQSLEGTLTAGRGLQASLGARVEALRGIFERNRDFAILAGSAGTHLTMTDVTVSDTQSQERDLVFWVGLQVTEGAEAEITRGAFEQNRTFGVYAGDEGTNLLLSDVVVRGTQGQESEPRTGRGLQAALGANVEVHRGLFQRNMELGVAVSHDGTTLSMAETAVRDTQSVEGELRFGVGLQASEGAQVALMNAVFERNRYAGVAAHHDGTSVTMTNVAVLDTFKQECAVDTCSGEGAGHGMVARNAAYIDARGLLIAGHALCGVQVAHGGTMDLQDSVVSDNPIGANVQSEGFDWDRLLDDVIFRDNERDFDSTFLPVPEPALPLDWLDEENP